MTIRQSNPVANQEAVVLAPGGHARFTVLTDRMIRMEWSPTGRFEDRASQAFIHRATDVPRFTATRRGRDVELSTESLRLFFSDDGKAFHPGNLRVEFDLDGRTVAWLPGAADGGNLGGTTRTLDMVDGACPVEPGLLSRDGWAVVDDSRRLVFERRSTETERPWLVPRGRPGSVDWYFFGYGHDFADALRDFTRVSGRVPIPPRYVFGAWWSRYWAYTDAELRDLVGQFREHDVPVDVLVVDMDWHLDGWTGYTWSGSHFPDPDGFLAWAKEQGLRVTLNLHPADGVGRHEAAFGAMARWMRMDPRRAKRVPFDCTDPRFVEGYFRLLHWPLERQGVDFWWMDWQQGTRTNVAGLDPLWWLNHLHWDDLERRQAGDSAGARRGERPLVFSRWGGLGNHRYPIGFSGDTFSTWKSLAWQAPFTAMAGNVGYAYWSHDIGGHQPGPVEPELYVRWIQYGVMSPVLRTHTSKNPLGERRIWAYPDREFRAMRDAFALRYRLIPYLYTAARRCYDDATPLCRPLYHAWPKEARAYEQPGQYLLGEDLLVAPVSAPGDRTSRCAAQSVWIPPGRWTEWYTGRTHEGPGEVELLVPLEEIPIFVRDGGIIPTGRVGRSSNHVPLDHITLLLFPGDRGSTRVYEDDGLSHGYESGHFAWTPISFRREGRTLSVDIAPAEGGFTGMVEDRSWEIRLCDRWPAAGVRVDGVELHRAEASAAQGWWYDDAKLTVVVRLPAASVRRPRQVEVELDAADEGPLRDGLHGKLKLLDTTKALVGLSPSRKLPSAADLRAEAITARGRGKVAQTISDRGRWSMATAIVAGGDLDVARSEAVCRLLGLSCSMRIESGAEPGIVRTTTTARLIGGEPGCRRTVELAERPSRPWAPIEGRSSETPINAGIAVQREWRTERPLQQTTLRATVIVRDETGESISVGFEESVLPSINGWWVIGPFDGSPDASLDRRHPPEAELRLDAEYAGKGGRPVRWSRVERTIEPGDDPTREMFVDLHRAFGSHTDDAVAYAVTFLESETGGPGLLAVGSDDGVAIWMNGVEVHRNHVQRGYGSKQDWVKVTLNPGVNTLLLKIAQAKGAWGFGVHLEDGAGAPLRGTTVRLDR